MSALRLLLLLAVLLSGCSARYFHDAGSPPSAATRHELASWPYGEIWSGVIFNGEKIGFTHLALQASRDAPGRFELRAEAAIALRFLGIEKKVNLRSFDLVRDDLSLERFEYEYVIDGTPMQVTGRVDGERLIAEVVTGGKPFEQAFSLPERIYPTSALDLIPAYRGLQVGAQYAYTVYDGENQRLGEVTQKVQAYETSELFEGAAFKVETRLHGLSTTSWIDQRARPVFELALNGVMISALEDEERAKRYLAQASLNKQDALIDFSRVKPDRPIERPREVRRLEVSIAGLPPGTVFPTGPGQNCAEGEPIRCEIRSLRPAELQRAADRRTAEAKYLARSVTVQVTDPTIRATAQRIVGSETDALAQVQALVAWIQANVRREAVDVFSALDVLQTRRAECQGHAWLYAALARSLGIPTRVVSGLVYSEELGGFLYHSWNESEVGGAWIPVDPTFGQVGVDATHIRMLEGDTLGDLLPMVNWVGRVKITVWAVGYGD